MTTMMEMRIENHDANADILFTDADPSTVVVFDPQQTGITPTELINWADRNHIPFADPADIPIF